MITEVHQQGRFNHLSTGSATHYENLKPHVPSPEDGGRYGEHDRLIVR